MVQPHPSHAFSLSIQFTGSPGNCLLFLTVVRPTPVLCLAAQLCPTLCDPMSQRVAHQAPLSREFSRQDYQSGLPCPSPGDLPNWNRTGVSCIAARFFTS